ncbi:N-acetylglucosamine-6-phosphate deacetylase [Roseiconus nitratireducens]|uniref:N-acetylglucosamine-6-phosphate deacetylase n=1 Tax=Roseiconus nitratireducens TaxID=2605748 RepID=A0A5M6DHG6_9BACT|nr:N-acetylglucosamine-6-phosphate deacetylase [Roseiconus nitratireducens]KAA5546984.1 N-acetylglucosamine-6-phosphate deacetylase [Roseiconus nitratireducens]
MSGFVDVQVNGYAGVDFNSDDLTPELLRSACQRLRADGVASFFPTIITDDASSMMRRISRITSAVEKDAQIAELVAGIHVEGPFLSREKGFVGAHPPQHVMDAGVDLAMRLVDAGRGMVRLLTLAPESPGSSAVIRRLAEEKVIVAAGHTDASLDQLDQAIDAGLTMFTHLGNACPALVHRHDNIVQRGLAFADRLDISFIADGHHVPFFALANYLSRVPSERVVIVTDAISAAGLGPGTYRLAGQEVEVDPDLSAWAKGREHFAGCATTMPRMAELLKQKLHASDDQIDAWTRRNPGRLLAAAAG